MAQDRLILLRNKETGEEIYTTKNRKSNPKKIVLKKYSKKKRMRITFTESKR